MAGTNLGIVGISRHAQGPRLGRSSAANAPIGRIVVVFCSDSGGSVCRWRLVPGQTAWARMAPAGWVVSVSRLRAPSDAISTASAPAAPATAKAADAPALCARAPAAAAPAAAPAEEEVESQENASVRAPAGAARSTMP